jgi:hypothetical protein
MTSPPHRRIEVAISSKDDGSAQTPEDAIRAVEEALRKDPPAEGDVFVFLGMEYPDVENLMAAVRALQPLWE